MTPLDELRGKAVATAEEFAPVIGRSPRTVHRMLDAGELPELRLGRSRYVAVPAFLRMIGADVSEQQSAPPGENGALKPSAERVNSTGPGYG